MKWFYIISFMVLFSLFAGGWAHAQTARYGMLSVIGKGAGGPDDLAVGPDDALYRLTASGKKSWWQWSGYPTILS